MRVPWLFASWVGGILAALIIGIFADVLKSTIALAAFIPVIMGMGGNIGTQSSTMIVRGLATGRVSIENSVKILFKEIRVGLILGILYGLLLGVFAIFQFINVSPMIGLVVGLSICISMIIAATIGSLVPLILNRFEIDPAIATGPFVTTAIDILGVAFYFIVKIKSFFNSHGKQIVILITIAIMVFIALKYEIDTKMVVFGTVILGVFTQAFAGLAALIATLPVIGPLIVKIFTIPIFWVLNSMGYFVGAVAVKKGYGSEFTKSRVLTLALLVGIILGYIIGHLVPLR